MRSILLLCLLLISPLISPQASAAISPKEIRLPPGFQIEVYADKVKGARSMALGSDGTLYVGTRSEGKVYAIPDRNRDGIGDSVITVAEGLDTPNGVAVHDGALFIAENHRILRVDSIASITKSIAKSLTTRARPQVVSKAFPTERHHGWRYLRFGPDGKLYVSVGAPCNVCERKDDPKFASILRMNPDSSVLEIFASGVRNSIGFDWNPKTGDMWFTDNGRDLLGDDIPGDELNRAPRAGLSFGFPYCHAGTVSDPEFGKNHPCSNYVAPERVLGPHVAALGMRFYTGSAFPTEYRNSIFIAEHGSWNRTTPIGYRIMRVKAGATSDAPLIYEVFAEGWLQNKKEVLGRPVDVEIAPDGALYVSDDYANAVYRISYKPNSRRATPLSPEKRTKVRRPTPTPSKKR